MSEFLNHLLERAAKLQKTIALAEGSDPRVAEAAEIFTREKIGKIVLIGNEAEIRAKYPEFKFHNVTFRDPGAGDKYVEKYAKKLYELRKEKGMTEEVAMRTIKGNNMFYACTALKCGDVDGVVGGAVFSSADVSRAAFQVIKAAPGIKSVSSCFVMIPPETSNIPTLPRSFSRIARSFLIPPSNSLPTSCRRRILARSRLSKSSPKSQCFPSPRRAARSTSPWKRCVPHTRW